MGLLLPPPPPPVFRTTLGTPGLSVCLSVKLMVGYEWELLGPSEFERSSEEWEDL